MNKEIYDKLLDYLEGQQWEWLLKIMEWEGVTPEEFYIKLANDRCKNCKAKQCNNCSIYEFDSNYVDIDTLYEMGYLDEEYCFKFD